MAAKKTDKKPKLIVQEINLLPSSLKPKKYALKVSKTLKRVLTVGYLFFFVGALVVGAVIIFLSFRVKGSLENQDKLITEIKAYEQSEQRLVLIKDRVEKIKIIYAEKSASDEIEILVDTLDKFTEGVEFKEASLVGNSADITISTPNSHFLGRFIAILVGSGSYRRIELLSFSYGPEKGYEITFGLSK